MAQWVCNAGDTGLGVGNGNPLQYSCLENFMDRGAWQFMVSLTDTTEHIAVIYKVIE